MAVNKFGAFDYDQHNAIITSDAKPQSGKLRTGDRVGEAGAYTGGGLRASERITIAGVIYPTPVGTPNLYELWDDLYAHHQPGTPQPLRLKTLGEKFIWAEVESVIEVQASPPFINARQFEVSFFCADPHRYHEQPQGPQNLSLNGSTNILNGGKSPAAPVVSLTISHPGTATVQTNSGAFKLVAHQTGVYAIDSDERFVTRDVVNYHYGWDGVFPSLPPGNASLSLSITAPGTISAAVARWFNRD
jgi:hypothetical protein